jgi:hypothetical protein
MCVPAPLPDAPTARVAGVRLPSAGPHPSQESSASGKTAIKSIAPPLRLGYAVPTGMGKLEILAQ